MRLGMKYCMFLFQIRNITHKVTKLSIFLVLGYLIILVPFTFRTGMVEISLNHQFFVIIKVLALLAILVCIHWLSKKEIASCKIRFSWLDIIVSSFFGYYILNYYIVADYKSLTPHLLESIALAILYIIVRALPVKNYWYLLYFLMVSGICQAVYGQLQLFSLLPSNHDIFRITGSFFNPGPYSGYLAMIFPIALTIYLFRNQIPLIHLINLKFLCWLEKQSRIALCRIKSNSFRSSECISGGRDKLSNDFRYIDFVFKTAIPLLTMSTVLVVLPATNSRAAWAAVAISTLILLIVKFIRTLGEKLKSNFWLYVVFSIVLLLSFPGLYFIKKDSANGRLLIWKSTLLMIKDKPLLGHGVVNFNKVYMNYQAEYLANKVHTQEAQLASVVII